MSERGTPVVPVSWGELLDKMTILEIKQARLSSPAARAHVREEYGLLHATGAWAMARADVRRIVLRLRRINLALWSIEDAIRVEDAAGRFGPRFIRLARAVYRMNDRRAATKRAINDLLQSPLVEEKSYAGLPGTAAKVAI